MDTLVLTAGRDEIIPKSSTANLLNSCPNNITHQAFPSADHQNISYFDPYYEAINDFIHSRKSSSGVKE